MAYSPYNQGVISARNAEIIGLFLRIPMQPIVLSEVMAVSYYRARLDCESIILCRWSSSRACANAVSYFPSHPASPWVAGILPCSISDFTVFRKKSLFRMSLSASP